MKKAPIPSLIIVCAAFFSVVSSRAGSFNDDVNLLRKHTYVLVLTDASQAGKIAVIPSLQGVVLASAMDGGASPSMGWFDAGAIMLRKLHPEQAAWGGEDRLVFGPESQPFALEDFNLRASTRSSAAFHKKFHAVDSSGRRFDVVVRREIRMLEADDVADRLGGGRLPSNVKLVAFETVNTVENTGSAAWSKASGALSLNVAGEFRAGSATVAVLPRKPGTMAADVLTSVAVPGDRLVQTDAAVLCKADAKWPCEVGLPQSVARPVVGSYDPVRGILTLIRYDLPKELWGYYGAAVTFTNQGPVNAGGRVISLGFAYGFRTSSPILNLAPRASVSHTQTTIHMRGTEETLDGVARAVLGVSLEDMRARMGS